MFRCVDEPWPGELLLTILVALGLDESDNSKTTLDVYRQYFEKPYLADTARYYTEESKRFLADNSVVEYMKKASTCTADSALSTYSHLYRLKVAWRKKKIMSGSISSLRL